MYSLSTKGPIYIFGVIWVMWEYYHYLGIKHSAKSAARITTDILIFRKTNVYKRSYKNGRISGYCKKADRTVATRTNSKKNRATLVGCGYD